MWVDGCGDGKKNPEKQAAIEKSANLLLRAIQKRNKNKILLFFFCLFEDSNTILQ